jgi:diguanylate cyclase (GGDEF)-like protein
MAGGHTTMIQRVLERRAEKPPSSDEGTSATIAVMVRVLPPPKALLVFEDAMLCAHTERRIGPELLDFESTSDELGALRRLKTEYRPIVLTDNPEFLRKLRSSLGVRVAFALFVSGVDDPLEREAALLAGADDCIERRAVDEEFNARLRGARRIAELEAVARTTLTENRKLSAIDDLTQLGSRRFFRKQFPREVERAARCAQPLSLMLCDIDLFKKINDTFGHTGGDDILRQFGPRLQKGLRASVDWVARIGGEEFAVVMPDTGYAGALAAARRMRTAVANTPFKADKKSLPVTASFGLCTIERVPDGQPRIAERLVKTADAALYRSKNDGRNRVTATVLKVPDSA